MANAQQGLNEQLTGGRELSYINQRDNYAGSLFSRIIDAVNTGFTNAGVSAVGKVSPPPKVDNITIQGTLASGILTCPGEIFHAVLTHNQSVNKGIRYFSEIDTNPNFTAPHVIDHGTSRSVFLNLPTFMNDNKTLQTYYHRSYAQYTGSNPCTPTVFGGLGGAIGIQMSGTNGATLLTSTGSGTASTTGQQGGKGLGTVLQRPAPQPKRSV